MYSADRQFLRMCLRAEMLRLCVDSIDSVLDALDEENWDAASNHQDDLLPVAAVVCGIGVVFHLNDVCDTICGEFLQRLAKEDRRKVETLLREVNAEYRNKKERKD